MNSYDKYLNVTRDKIQKSIRPYSPIGCKPLAYLKAGYKGKGPNGGRKCIYRQSRLYKDESGHAIPWSWNPVTRFELPRSLQEKGE